MKKKHKLKYNIMKKKHKLIFFAKKSALLPKEKKLNDRRVH